MSSAIQAGFDERRGSVQKRFSDQRARLLALEYHDPFTTESLALVERLFDDVVTTTESYDDLQQRVRAIIYTYRGDVCPEGGRQCFLASG